MSDPIEKATAALEDLSPLRPLVRGTANISTGAEGCLRDIPIVIKANIAVEGLPHCGACPALEDNIAAQSAPAVQRLLDAGATIVGQANMHELAFGITSHNLYHGPVGNPANPAHMSGGSSGGTAAAVASGAIPMGLASDTGGSGRLPAAMCGCVGFRPTHGRYPAPGVLTLSTSFDTVTPMAGNVAGVALLDAVLSGAPTQSPRAGEQLTLGIVQDALWEGVDLPMAKACQDRLDRLANTGTVTLVTKTAPTLRDLCAEIAMGIVLFETKVFWDAFLAKKGTNMTAFIDQIASPDVAGVFKLIVGGAAPTEDIYRDMVEVKRIAIRKQLSALLADVDGLVMPTLVTTAPCIGETETCRINGIEVPLFDAMTARALVASISGNPSITLPAGQIGGLPIGFEIIGRHSEDAALLDVAARVEFLLEESENR